MSTPTSPRLTGSVATSRRTRADWLKTLTPNRIMMILVVAGYAVVNIRMQLVFFGGGNIFAKYQVATSAADAHRIAQDAYYAKTAFLLLLLILLTFKVAPALAAGISFVTYSIIMVVFFGFNGTTTAYFIGSVALFASYFVKWPRRWTTRTTPEPALG